MRSFARLSGIIGAAALASAGLALAPAAATAQVTVGASAIVPIPCSASALASAITAANISLVTTTIQLPPYCTIVITSPATSADGLPIITGNITIAGSQNDVITLAPFVVNHRILEVASGGTLGLDKVTMTGGNISDGGGAIKNAGTLNVDRSKLSGNAALFGGAVYNTSTGTATISRTLINQNSAFGTNGGGIYNSGTAFLSISIVDSNFAAIDGGGLFTAVSALSHNSQMTYTNNTAGIFGGGIYNAGDTSLNGSQVRLNSASSDGGGIYSVNIFVFLTSTIVRDNTPDNCVPFFTGCS